MQEVFDRLSEKDKRLYAGVEALKFLMAASAILLSCFPVLAIQFSEDNELKAKATIPKNGTESGRWSKTSY